MYSRRLLGLPVVEIDSGRAVGRVQRLIVDPKARRVEAFLVNAGHWTRDERLVLWASARGVGDHAVMIPDARALCKPALLPHLTGLLQRRLRLYGTRVLTEDGALLGSVEELVLDGRTGVVKEVLFAPTTLGERLRGPLSLPAEALLSIGEDAVVARAGVRPTLHRARPGRDLPAPAPASSGAGTPPEAANGHHPHPPASPLALQRVGRFLSGVRRRVRGSHPPDVPGRDSTARGPHEPPSEARDAS